jgi:hypothetical protein
MPFGSDKEGDDFDRVALAHRARRELRSTGRRVFGALFGLALRALLVLTPAILAWVLFDLVA